MKPTKYIWHKGRLVRWEEATVHVLAHGLHYGSSIFEGIRVYDTPQGPAWFCLDAHLRRLGDTARIYRMPLPHDREAMANACHEVVAANGLRSAYVRPIAYRGLGTLKVNGEASPVEVAIAAFEWGSYLGEEALRAGVDIGVSSWQRVAPNTLPTMAKAGANYLSSQLITMEAARHGYAEGLALDSFGHVSEGAGQNIFLVRDGVLYTPPVAAAILPGITRQVVLELAGDLGIPVREMAIPREMLYTVDEIFLTGTASEIVPVRSVDGLEVGPGHRGPVTERLQQAFFGLFDGTTPDTRGWLVPVRPSRS
ncbi:MAG: branched-chain amino acid transaminase [Verrucomicrobia bacterium]|nr:MAG: branched-chain amino acid transaminase [Verrucomicrobiota bacterium]